MHVPQGKKPCLLTCLKGCLPTDSYTSAHILRRPAPPASSPLGHGRRTEMPANWQSNMQRHLYTSCRWPTVAGKAGVY
eukprot:1159116-Pelagomonas_calceolata.AAC.3